MVRLVALSFAAVASGVPLKQTFMKSIDQRKKKKMCFKTMMESKLCKTETHSEAVKTHLTLHHEHDDYNHHTGELTDKGKKKHDSALLDHLQSEHPNQKEFDKMHPKAKKFLSLFQSSMQTDEELLVLQHPSQKGKYTPAHPALAIGATTVLKTLKDACSHCHLFQCSPGLCYAGLCPQGSPSDGTTMTGGTTPCPSTDYCWNPSPIKLKAQKYKMCFGGEPSEDSLGFFINHKGLVQDPQRAAPSAPMGAQNVGASGGGMGGGAPAGMMTAGAGAMDPNTGGAGSSAGAGQFMMGGFHPSGGHSSYGGGMPNLMRGDMNQLGPNMHQMPMGPNMHQMDGGMGGGYHSAYPQMQPAPGMQQQYGYR